MVRSYHRTLLSWIASCHIISHPVKQSTRRDDTLPRSELPLWTNVSRAGTERSPTLARCSTDRLHRTLCLFITAVTKGQTRPFSRFSSDVIKKVQKSASKLMATIFWDSEGVLLIDYLPKGTTMNGQYYANILAQAREDVVQKRRGKLSRGVLFLQDNASVHTARVSRQALKDTGFSEIDHPPHNPDLTLSDYFLFSNLKKELRGRRFVDDNQMKMAVESHFDCKEKEYFLGGLKALYTRCEKCISLERDNIEK
ncbi:Mariner Mos1 transposase [Eumeta japonica]|uniref:Mariner Mos1 transposase n=1 Tax=Eumeta variegata TaxID=151549 RepID=A0A4C1Y0G7_EUMVA|nr:Mariner Mos1 transposase [Eumeta japonica]